MPGGYSMAATQNKHAVFGSSATATFPARGGRSLANAGMQQMTPRAPNAQASIATKGQFDDVEHTFKFWVSGTEAGRHSLWQAWEQIDYNGNGIVSLAEIDKWVVESYPKLNNKAALMRHTSRVTWTKTATSTSASSRCCCGMSSTSTRFGPSSIRWMLIQIGDWPFQSFDKGCHCLE